MADETFLDPEELDHLGDFAAAPRHRTLIIVILFILVLVGAGATTVPDVRGMWYRLVKTPEPQGVAWRETLTQAVAESADSGKPLLLVFTSGAPANYTMMNEVWPAEGVRKLVSASFVPLRLELAADGGLAEELKINSAPTVVVLHKRQERARLTGFYSASALEFELQRALDAPSVIVP
jgi:hypothetical protein